MQIAQARPPFVEFKQIAINDPKRSNELGYRVTKDVDRAYIMQPGSRDVFEIDAEQWLKQIRQKAIEGAHDAYPQEWIDQFQKKYELFKEGQEQPPNGTHVREWPVLSPSQVQNLVAARIITVEDVANLTEEALGRVGMGSRELREKARDWLAARDVAKNAAKENEELKTQIAELMARISELEADKPKRGRPAKDTTDKD